MLMGSGMAVLMLLMVLISGVVFALTKIFKR